MRERQELSLEEIPNADYFGKRIDHALATMPILDYEVLAYNAIEIFDAKSGHTLTIVNKMWKAKLIMWLLKVVEAK